HGGPIVAVLGGIDQILWFFIAVIVGSLVTMSSVLFLRKKTPALAIDTNGIATGMVTEQQDNESEASATTHTTTNINKEKTTEQINNTVDVFDKNVIKIVDKKNTRDEAIDDLIDQLDKNDYITDKKELKDAVLKREAEATTAIGMHVAIPHAKSSAVKQPVVAVMNNKHGIDWESLDGTLPNIVFLIAVPNDSSDTHLKLLQRLSRTLMDDNIRKQLIEATQTQQIYDLLKEI
ncbi:MAG: PTS transporter subunit EIIA, partial [Staphylococcus xylosus]|nr:PTS transporter subunit EIIA [Staphylococcus xylosus]